jgi:KDO2-lipid IV(A) lauroyltransferase
MRSLLFILAQLPLPVLHGIAAIAGWLLWVSNNKRREVGLRNLERCMPELSLPQRTAIAKSAIVEEMKTYAEAPLVWFGSRKRALKLTKVFHGMDKVDALLARGKGLILLTPHLGAFEACAMKYAAHHPITGLYKPQKGKLEAIVLEGRYRFGATMISTEGGGSREKLLPILARNETTYFIPDQDPPEGRGVFAPFFGVTAHTPVLVQRLIQASGAPVIFFTAERLSWGRGFVGHFREAPEAIYSEDMLTSATAMNSGIEAMIREYPGQYWWGHKRFRRQPEGAPTFYGALSGEMPPVTTPVVSQILPAPVIDGSQKAAE